jgi:hypothetical protein
MAYFVLIGIISSNQFDLRNTSLPAMAVLGKKKAAQ